MIKQFGNTWWGKKWLDALKNIDFSNRLPRGKTYARNKSVLSIKIKGNEIISKVQENKKKSYDQVIRLKEFDNQEKNRIIKTIIDNSLYLSQLLNKKLPIGLYDDLKNFNIELFPKSWGNLKTGCSCPDLATPCKHIAAVIYLIANEIDKNPFTVFLLHNLDILKEIQKYHFYINNNDSYGIFNFKKKLSNSRTKNNSITNHYNNFFEIFDFSKIPELDKDLLSILSNKPLFYSKGDFKKVLEDFYTNLKKEINKYLEFTDYMENKMNIKSFDFILKDFDNLDCIIINYNYDYRFKFSDDNKKGLIGKTAFFSLINIFNNTPHDIINKSNKKIIFLYYLYHFALNLIKNGAIIPQLVNIDGEKYKIRWIPPLINEEIKIIIDLFKDHIINGLLKIYENDKSKEQEATFYYLENDEELLTIISLFINEITESLIKDKIDNKDYIQSLFFLNEILNIKNSFEMQEIPNTINLWLSKFYIIHKNFIPIVKIEINNDDKYIIDVLIEKKENIISIPVHVSQIFENNKYLDIKYEVMKDLDLLENYFNEINIIIESNGKEKITIDPDRFATFFFKIIPAIKLIGIKILLPQKLKNIIKPKPSLSIEKKSNPNLINYMSLPDILSFEWNISLGDRIITKNDFLKLIRGLSGIVKINDQFIFIDENDINSILKFIETSEPELKIHDLLKAGFEEEYEGHRVQLSKDAKKIYGKFLLNKPINPPESINASLREYQLRGYQWLYKNIQMGFGCLIADDMGLGKTLQIITVLQKLKDENGFNSKKALIIMPTTLLTNWQKELIKFAPDLNFFIYHGRDRSIKDKKFDLLLTSYGIIRSDIEIIKKTKWFLTIIDEAQNIKNPNSIQTRTIKKIESDIKIAVTGTPIENRLLELWSLFDFINKGYLGNLHQFKTQYAIPIEVFRNQEKLIKFKKITSPFILRRLKTDKSIIKDLPEKIEIDEFCNMTPEQTALYQSVVNKTMKKIEDSKGIERKGLILKLMIALKQICNHPSNFLKQSLFDPSKSGKSMLLIDLIEKILDNNEKVLIFTQYKEMGDILIKIIKNHFNITPSFLHGGISRHQRDDIIDHFQKERNNNIMILTLKAGGVGLNLTGATYVIHYDLWWNPAIENQATDRAYRIGQTKNVLVYRLLTQGTLEEKINNMINEKKELANLTISQCEKWISELPNNILKQIINLN